MASIDKRQNGSYRIRVSVGKNCDGKRIFETMNYFPESTTPSKIKKEVEKVASDFEKRVEKGLYLTGDKLTFVDFIPTWKEEWGKDNLTQSALESYISALNYRAVPKIGSLPLGSIRPSHIQAIVTDMKNEGKAPKTIKRTITAINSVFRYAYRMEVIESNPVDRVSLPKQAKKDELHYFTVEQTQAFLGALQKEYECPRKSHKSKSPKTGEEFEVKGYTQKTSIPYQWQVYFSMAIYGAFRRGELVAIQWRDINWEDKTVSIKRAFSRTRENGQVLKTTKTESGIRTISLPENVLSMLKEWYSMEKSLSLKLGSLWEGHRGKEFDKNFVFIQLGSGLPMDVNTPTHKFKEILEMYNATCEKEEDKLPIIRLHDLRHTSATLLLSNGLDIETVSHRLGHKHCSVTLDVYGHWMEETDQKASDTLEKLLTMKAN